MNVDLNTIESSSTFSYLKHPVILLSRSAIVQIYTARMREKEAN